MEKWRTSACGGRYSIKKVEVIHETECYVTLRHLFPHGGFRDTRERKDGGGVCFSSTFEEAKQHICQEIEKSINGGVIKIDEAQKELERIKTLRDE